jgi:hypothetical protein
MADLPSGLAPLFRKDRLVEMAIKEPENFIIDDPQAA